MNAPEADWPELGFRVLEPGEELIHRDLTITAVAARHDGAAGDRDERTAAGQVDGEHGANLYA